MKQKGFSCGVMLSYFVLRVFAERGQYDMVYELLVNEGEHGWVNMLREGATICFEAWGERPEMEYQPVSPLGICTNPDFD